MTTPTYVGWLSSSRLAGRNPREAVEAFLEPLRDAIGCISHEPLMNRGGFYVTQPPHVLTLGRTGDPVPLRGEMALAFRFAIYYRIVETDDAARGPWKVSIAGYSYAVDDAKTRREILAYHWHPEARGEFPHPHLHLTASLALPEGASRYPRHLPTARIAAEDIVRCLIAEFGVLPLKPDWEDVLERSQRAFESYRIWSGTGPPPRSSP